MYKSKFKKMKISENDEFEKNEPDWSYYKKEIERRFGKRGWNVFDNVKEYMSVKEFVDIVKNGIDDLIEYNGEYIYESSTQCIEEMLVEDGFDVSDISFNYSDEYNELVYAVEESANFNVEALVPYELFIYDDQFESQGMYSDEEYMDSSDYKGLRAEAKKFGFSDADFNEVWNNATYGGSGGVGIIVDAEDVYKLSTDQIKEIEGNVILYIRDSGNGSGHYVLGRKTKKLKFKNNKDLANNIDYGSYSLGDVFGTTDWTWR